MGIKRASVRLKVGFFLRLEGRRETLLEFGQEIVLGDVGNGHLGREPFPFELGGR